MLSEQELGQFFADHFHRVAARLEVRDYYDNDTERDELTQYLAGKPGPDLAGRGPWLEQLRADRRAGKSWRWIHVITGPLNSYLKCALEWGYAANAAAGAEVRILDLAEQYRPDTLIDRDYWAFDDGAVLLMHYDRNGRFTGAEPAPEREGARYRRSLQAAWSAGVPLDEYWQGHPQYHRALTA